MIRPTMKVPGLHQGSRLMWATLGTALLAAGSSRRTLWDTGAGIAGTAMLAWAVAAPCIAGEPERDIVDISSEDSFPASDPPSSW